MNNSEKFPKQFSDMSSEEFKKLGYATIDWIASYLENIEKYPVLPDIKYGEVKKNLLTDPPLKGEDPGKFLKEIDDVIMKGITHWNHPDFMAYFNSTSSGPGILAELLSAGFNINGMAWHTCPSATELEETMIEWLVFPEIFGELFMTPHQPVHSMQLQQQENSFLN